jgi:hypothetical protein
MTDLNMQRWHHSIPPQITNTAGAGATRALETEAAS